MDRSTTCGIINSIKRATKAQQATNQHTTLKTILDNFERGLKDGSVMGADDNAIMRSVVEQIIIRKDEIEIEFKCGVTYKHEYVR